MKTALVIMAAGMGSRFGGGIKQLEPVGPNGEIIMDYSIHDAMKAGFGRVICIIKPENREIFEERIGRRHTAAKIEYAYQRMTDLMVGDNLLLIPGNTGILLLISGNNRLDTLFQILLGHGLSSHPDCPQRRLIDNVCQLCAARTVGGTGDLIVIHTLIHFNLFAMDFQNCLTAFQIRQLIEQLEFLERQVAELEEQIFSLLKQTGSYITTIPGIGDTLGAIILSEIGDIHRFDAPNKLVAFAGLDVRVTQSGEFTGTRQKISKRGSPYLRRAIWLAASRAAFCDPILSEYYQGLRARGKHHLTAVGAVSRKLCNTIYTILKEDRPWQPIPPKGKKVSNYTEE